MAPLEPWEKVLVDAEIFLETEHGQLACTYCHAGEQSPNKDAAHNNLIAFPSNKPLEICGECHPEVVALYPSSLHATQQGYWTALNARSAPENHAEIEEMFGNHCASCHTNCGDCHVSQPRSVGGGFIEGHLFNKTPSLTRNCTACHGSRVGNEYLGKHEDLKADVHFRKGRMKCTDCHSAQELHGDYETLGYDSDETPNHRYSGTQYPNCVSCHESVTLAENENITHQLHNQRLSCQVCHSISYSNCDGCHVQVSEDTGQSFFETEGTYLSFLIGQNPIKSDERPYDYVPVRHVPIAPTSYQHYGENLLPNFDALPTWTNATPHNIQLETPQNMSCESCHGNPEVFLTVDKLMANELEANQEVIVKTIPLSVEQILADISNLPEDHVNYSTCRECHEAGGEVPALPENHTGYFYPTCNFCHTNPQP